MMQVLQNEIRNLRLGALAAVVAPTSVAPTTSGPIAGVGAASANDGALEMHVPISAISLMQWMGMKLDTFDGSGTPLVALNWLTYVEDKMEVFEVVYDDRVGFNTTTEGRSSDLVERCVGSPPSYIWAIVMA